MINVGVIGSTGYAGQQLVWFLHRHPQVKISFLSSHNHTGNPFSNTYPNYRNFMQNICIDIHEAEQQLSTIDVLFIALPHGKSFELAKKALALNVKVIDLGADFRLKDAALYKDWYDLDHGCPQLLPEAVYGLPELHRDKIKKANLIANPGCYPTASILALAPLLKEQLVIEESIVVDAKSGVSGAGRTANIATLYTECSESIKAYGVASHRHTPEIEQELSLLNGSSFCISFTPHLVPMNRGILATCYGSLRKKITKEALHDYYQAFYQNEYFVRVIDTIPETRNVKGSNLCDIGLCIDERTGRVIVISAIDNLIKGAAGQAVQNMNLMFELEEIAGLDVLPMIP
ncbi:N-acetyl-gamma-glutamyl-phosphate reductase [Geosporobacter ferrireducens]|uniref:N-acetyl-gamma-glutamyl-phosphate reductase n=1 Tax=Geosporobacter ferrireducens TaxID=1424294 RepID=UPI00139B0A5C|nr:N-acetyl-gamma-glutamyl-phosphate reductase [Geosporobacter ferrireducens]MTI57239.1 N-acetyl-gamma-glutamyl-phosphate reductase [Geosporobacter ferrireducens]